MKEEMSILQVYPTVINDSEIRQLIFEIDNNLSSMMILTRNYLFNNDTRGHSLSHAQTVSAVIDKIVTDVINRLRELPQLQNMNVFERGIGLNLQKIEIDVLCAKNRLLIDDVDRQIRIAVQGISTFDGVLLDNGSAYIIDNVSGYRFTASADAVHLVFNYINQGKDGPPWRLWKRKYE